LSTLKHSLIDNTLCSFRCINQRFSCSKFQQVEGNFLEHFIFQCQDMHLKVELRDVKLSYEV